MPWRKLANEYYIMSRGIMRGSSDICADCQAPDPGWSSINRGVLICEECCGVHRSLGRHISQVKSLKKGQWSSTQLAMVHQLVSLGANSIWEHSLLDPSQHKHGRRKPNPRDPVHPMKADFIRAKYQFLTFMNKQKDSEINSTEDLSQQLHSAVRTGNLEISLRLLSAGAEPNYFHPDKGTSPLHVGAASNQPLQVELLLVFGADPGAYDASGRTPGDVARKEGFTDIADRLVESQYELTDRLTFYLCGKKPDHRSGQHFLIPAMADSSLDLSELAKAAKRKLQELPNHQFEELARDVYDEVDRREIEQVWMSTSNHTHIVTDRQNVPFLPVNPEFSSTRNQGRQKLARFNPREFATLIIDILTDVRRRQCPHYSLGTGTLNLSAKKSISIISDDEPLYDSVASDEDYASIGDNQSLTDLKMDGQPPVMVKENGEPLSLSKVAHIKVEEESLGDSSSTFSLESISSLQSDGPVTVEEYLDLKRLLTESQARNHKLTQSNKDLKQEIIQLKGVVERLVQESQSAKFTHAESLSSHSASGSPSSRDVVLTRGAGGTRPMSMFEPREQARCHHMSKHHARKDAQQTPSPSHVSAGQRREHSSSESVRTRENKSGSSSKTGSQSSLKSPPRLDHQTDSTESDYDNASAPTGEEEDPSSVDAEVQLENARLSGVRSEDNQSTDSLHTLPEEEEGGSSGALEGATAANQTDTLPTQEEIVKKTERITKKIQELLRNAQDGQRDWYVPSAEKIFTAVNDMVAIFPQTVDREQIEFALQQLTKGADRLREQCNRSAPEVTVGTSAEVKVHTQQVIQCAYDIAQAAKQLVMCFE